MFVFGHIGIGRLLIGSRGRGLPALPLLLGMLLPDVIDKPLYYAHISSVISCTRTVGHTGLSVALVLLVAYVRRSSAFLALGVGMTTHVTLDCLMDLLTSDTRSALTALTWPFLDTHFAIINMSVTDHLRRILVKPVMVTELIGLAVIAWEYWRSRHAPA
jgi:membrane-bound metal-dependent hydrolase YbcI (DUF457 family)